MNNIQNKSIAFLCIALAIPYLAVAQDSFTNELHYAVHKTYPYISLKTEKLKEANTLMDLNPHYKPSWIREYLSVELTASHNGTIEQATGKNELLTRQQKDLLLMADVHKSISVKVRYMPENTLQHNDPKELDFSFTIDPDNDAQYPGGQEQLNQYLLEHAIDKIPAGSFTGYRLAAVKFTISEAGEVSNVHVFESSNDEKTDALLVAAIRNMPSWKPADFSNGIAVMQNFVLTVGNMENCVVNLLNIRRD
ncbi:MAG: energy transducer TonB [Saprospiraceae bacterium]|jgi:hypothetical protein|nr:energy transducer TonB [Lewinellaceae bacterium]